MTACESKIPNIYLKEPIAKVKTEADEEDYETRRVAEPEAYPQWYVEDSAARMFS
jgi:hypothetical protein